MLSKVSFSAPLNREGEGEGDGEGEGMLSALFMGKKIKAKKENDDKKLCITITNWRSHILPVCKWPEQQTNFCFKKSTSGHEAEKLWTPSCGIVWIFNSFKISLLFLYQDIEEDIEIIVTLHDQFKLEISTSRLLYSKILHFEGAKDLFCVTV